MPQAVPLLIQIFHNNILCLHRNMCTVELLMPLLQMYGIRAQTLLGMHL